MEYKRSEQQLKKYETKVKKYEQLSLSYKEAASKGILDTDHCDMSCATQCIRPKNDLKALVRCFDEVCNCTIKGNQTEAMQKIEELIAKKD